MRFQDRAEAGRILAKSLSSYANRDDVLVLALPRGGVPVAFEVARALNAPLDVWLVRKLGVPGHEELAMGAIATGGVRFIDRELIERLGVPSYLVEATLEKERAELERRERLYRDDRPAPAVQGKTVILIDDGLATGSTMRAAITALRRHKPARIIVAVPTGARETCAELQKMADEVICTMMPEPFDAVGLWYRNFSQTSDEDVRDLLDRARAPAHSPSESPTKL